MNMKIVIPTILVLSWAASLFAQGTVILGNRFAGTYITHVYAGDWNHWCLCRGNGTADFPAGTFDWTGFTLLTGSGWTAQLLAADGPDRAESSLIAAPVTTTFRTGQAAGNLVQATVTLVGVPADSPMATVEMVVWENRGGTITTWAQAHQLWQAGVIAAGTSGTFNLGAIGGAINPAPILTPMQSFSVIGGPEPSSLALGILGVGVLLAARRRQRSRRAGS